MAGTKMNPEVTSVDLAKFVYRGEGESTHKHYRIIFDNVLCKVSILLLYLGIGLENLTIDQEKIQRTKHSTSS